MIVSWCDCCRHNQCGIWSVDLRLASSFHAEQDYQLKEQDRTIEALPMPANGEPCQHIDVNQRPQREDIFPFIGRNLGSFIVKYFIFLLIDVFASGSASP